MSTTFSELSLVHTAWLEENNIYISYPTSTWIILLICDNIHQYYFIIGVCAKEYHICTYLAHLQLNEHTVIISASRIIQYTITTPFTLIESLYNTLFPKSAGKGQYHSWCHFLMKFPNTPELIYVLTIDTSNECHQLFNLSPSRRNNLVDYTYYNEVEKLNIT